MFNGKKVLVTGGSGMIGRYLVDLLVAEGSDVHVVALDDDFVVPEGVTYTKADLTEKEACDKACKGMDSVFHLAGVKGSPRVAVERPASFMVPLMQFNLNMMEAAWKNGVEKYLYTSSIGVYQPAPLLREDDVWLTAPSPNDRCSGWAKRMGELQAEAYRIEHGWENIVIVRPANIYGRHDTFDADSGAMVVPSLIYRTLSGGDTLMVWGDGSAKRDFLHAQDAAEGILHMMKANPSEPVNIGSGIGVSIKDLVSTILEATGMNPEVVWDTSKPLGDSTRILDIARATDLGWKPNVSLAEGIKDTCEWLKNNWDIAFNRYSVFSKG
jgi:GDP-L-fucose synthase